MTRREAAEVVALLVAAYPVPSWTEETVGLYVHDIAEFDAAPARIVTETWRRGNDERPSIAQLRRIIAEEQRKKRRVLTLPAPESPEALRLVADDFDKLGEAFKGGRFGFKTTFADLAKKVRDRAKRLEGK